MEPTSPFTGAKNLELFLSALTDDASYETFSFGVVNGKENIRRKLSKVWPGLHSIKMVNPKVNLKGQNAKVKLRETWATSFGTGTYTCEWTFIKKNSGWFVIKKKKLS